MADWPKAAFLGNLISTHHMISGSTAGVVVGSHFGVSAGVWPAANRALYMPFELGITCTAYQICLNVSVQSGNLDVGIYDELGNRLVSSGSTAVGAAGIQVVNITDTTLVPGAYFIAMNVDNTTASFNSSAAGSSAEVLRTVGMQQQAVGAVTLPDPATFANPASAYVPLLFASTGKSTI